MKITPEIQEQINILYLKLGTKVAVAKEIGCSAVTVSKYIIPNFVLPENRKEEIFEGEVKNADDMINILNNASNTPQKICEYCMLSDEEWQQLKELQKEVYI